VHPDGTRGWFLQEWGQKENRMVRRPYRYVSEDDRDPLPDEAVAAWFVRRIGELAAEKDGKPFFMACGFIRPHTPLYAPKRFFDMFPPETVRLPVIRAGDRDDTFLHGYLPEDSKGPKYFRLLKESYPTLEEGLKKYLQAYLACVAFVDEQVGRVVDAVDRSPFKDNTVVVLASDHGYNHGQKDFLFKNSLWEESVRIPLIVRAPGVSHAGGECKRPVSLIDVYPTLVDLCGLKGDTRRSDKGVRPEGHSLRPLLADPKSGTWTGPDVALTVVYAGGPSKNAVAAQHYSVRSDTWRYILYPDGKEELYDHAADPREWRNLAAAPAAQETKRDLKRKLLEMTGGAPTPP
jgi:arylsulfatase A-like enzyme